MRFALFIASRYLRAKRRQAVISVITVISVLGVAAGVASLIIALAINNGFRQDLQDKLLGATADISLMSITGSGIQDWEALLQRMRGQPQVDAVSPALYEQVLVSRGSRARGVVLKGIVPDYERQVSDLLQTIKFGSASVLEPEAAPPVPPSREPESEGSDLEDEGPAPIPLPPIVLGKGVANDLGATLGSTVLVTSPQGELTPFGIVPKYVRFKVAGIFDSGFYDYDHAWAFIRLGDAQRLFGLGNVVSVLEFKVNDIYQAAAIGRRLEKAAGPAFMTSNWMEQNRELFRALRLERIVTFITIGLIVLVAALNILISLIMMVMEKTRDIAILMSMGARRAAVRRIFITQGLLIGAVGTILGLALGYGVCDLLGNYWRIPLSAEVYSIDYVPFAPRVIDGVLVAIVAVFISFVATIYPSWSASRVLPAEALRYE